MLDLPRILRPLLAGIPAILRASIAGFKRLAADLTNVGKDGAHGAQGGSGFHGDDSKINPAEAGHVGF